MAPCDPSAHQRLRQPHAAAAVIRRAVKRSQPIRLKDAGLMPHADCIMSLIISVLLFSCAAATAQTSDSSRRETGPLLLAQSIDPGRLNGTQQRVCCVAGTRRFHSTARACRRSGGAARPLTDCSVRRVETPMCCVTRGRASLKKPSECRQSGGEIDRTGQICRGQHVYSEVCCRRAGNAFATTEDACRRSGGGVTSWRFCPKERICCRTGTGPNAGHAWTGPGNCRGRKVDPASCRTPPRKICCRSRDGRMRIVERQACRPPGRIRPAAECSFGKKGSIGPDSRMGREVCCARRGEKALKPLLTCLSDGGREIEKSRCRIVCCYRGPVVFPSDTSLFTSRTTEYECRKKGGRVVDDARCPRSPFER